MTDATLQQLSDTSTANSNEVQAICATHPKAQQCKRTFLENLARTEPSLVPIFTATYNQTEDDLLALVDRKLSWVITFVTYETGPLSYRQRSKQKISEPLEN
jgi:hypothetical protein